MQEMLLCPQGGATRWQGAVLHQALQAYRTSELRKASGLSHPGCGVCPCSHGRLIQPFDLCLHPQPPT